MKKRYVAKEEVEVTSDIGKICGFTAGNEKGYLVYTGDDRGISAVMGKSASSRPNSSCGEHEDGLFSSVEDFVKNANAQFNKHHVCVTVENIYFFDSLKELYRWLSE